MKSNYCAQRKEGDKRDKSRKRQLTINEKKEERMKEDEETCMAAELK